MTAENLENAPLSAGEALIDHEPNIGYETSEPSLRTIVQRYYGAHFPADEAAAFTNQYFAVLATDKAKPTEPVGWREAAEVEQGVVERAGGWFATGGSWSGPWATAEAAQLANDGEYTFAHDAHRLALASQEDGE